MLPACRGAGLDGRLLGASGAGIPPRRGLKSHACVSPKLGLIFFMRVIAVSTLRQFWYEHPDAEQSIKAWVDEANKAQWTQPADIKAHYRRDRKSTRLHSSH